MYRSVVCRWVHSHRNGKLLGNTKLIYQFVAGIILMLSNTKSDDTRAEEIANYNKQVNTWQFFARRQLNDVKFRAISSLDSNSEAELTPITPVSDKKLC